jgi:3-dehydrosphinganine reductase
LELAEYDSSDKVLESACKPHDGATPDAVFLCAGMARLGFFVEETPDFLKEGMASVYWTQAWSAYVCILEIFVVANYI